MATQVSIDGQLLEQLKAEFAAMGFASVEAFVHYCIEKELKARREQEEAALAERLRGLGYLE